MFDPQLYLLDLPYSEDLCPKFAKNLSTYPWIGVEPPDFDSGQLRQIVEGEKEEPFEKRWKQRKDPFEKWETTVREAVNHQMEMDCDAILLPAPLIQDPETNLERDFNLLEQALETAIPLAQGKPIYASIPLADSLFAHRDFLENTLIEAIPDNLSTMNGLAGVYIPFIQISANPGQERIASQNCPGSLMKLARRFGSRTKLNAIFNFTESLGIILNALGAQGYASGYNLKQRRLHVSDFIPQRGGSPYPKFFSLEICTDFLPSRGLERIATKRLLGPLKKDETTTSIPLLKALKARKTILESAPEWAEIQGNITAARHHYFEQQARSHQRVPDAEAALTWMQDAEKSWNYLQQRFSEDPDGLLDPPANHLTPWRKALERLLEAETAD